MICILIFINNICFVYEAFNMAISWVGLMYRNYNGIQYRNYMSVMKLTVCVLVCCVLHSDTLRYQRSFVMLLLPKLPREMRSDLEKLTWAWGCPVAQLRGWSMWWWMINVDLGVADHWTFGQNVVLSVLDFFSLCDVILVKELFVLMTALQYIISTLGYPGLKYLITIDTVLMICASKLWFRMSKYL